MYGYKCIHRYVIIDNFLISVASTRLDYKHVSFVDKLLTIKHYHSQAQSFSYGRKLKENYCISPVSLKLP